jgi:hypothetical protein
LLAGLFFLPPALLQLKNTTTHTMQTNKIGSTIFFIREIFFKAKEGKGKRNVNEKVNSMIIHLKLIDRKELELFFVLLNV